MLKFMEISTSHKKKKFVSYFTVVNKSTHIIRKKKLKLSTKFTGQILKRKTKISLIVEEAKK